MLNPKKIVFYRVAYSERIEKVITQVSQVGKRKGAPPHDTRDDPTWTTALVAALEAEFGDQAVYALPHVMFQIGRWVGRKEMRRQ